jgi:phospholipase C
MGYCERADIPFYFALAEAFTLCDNYYCSVLGPTYPNRLYSMSGMIDPKGEHGGPLVETKQGNYEFTWTTMPEQLSAKGVSWKVYTSPEFGALDNVLTFFKAYKTNPGLAALGLKPTYPTDFLADLRNNELPQVSWINTAGLETEHPGLSTPRVGESVVGTLLRNLLKHHEVWKKTALFLTWDENGGFFDQVAPPVPPAGTEGEYLTVPDITGNDEGITGPIGLGFRVPLLIVSPFSRGGFLSSDVFDHTSLLRFLETRFGVEVPNLSAWRREHTGDLTSAFNFAEPDRKPGVKLPWVKLTKRTLRGGGCATNGPVTVPPNSPPEQPLGGHWRSPSGLV